MASADRPESRLGAVHPIQARLAFETGSGAYVARLIEELDAAVLIERIGDHDRRTVAPLLPERLAAILNRADVTRLDGKPLVLVNEGGRVLGVATGPDQAPQRLHVQVNISRIENGEAIEIPAVDPEQPSLQLIALSSTTGLAYPSP